MGNFNYGFLFDDMTWSYSRICTFVDCRYKFFLKYISKCEGIDKFFASYGSFMHKIIENYYRGIFSKETMLTAFLGGFSSQVRGIRPNDKIVGNYISSGIEYLKSFRPFPYEMVDVEKRIEFEIDGLKFVVIIDFIGKKDGKYYIIDNKSRDLKPRSKRTKPTKNDITLDKMLRQLYLYAAAVQHEYGELPEALCFNCFRTGVFIVEPFNEEAYHETLKWAKDEILKIKDSDDFYPSYEYFPCSFICDVSNECCYFDMARDDRRNHY